MSILSIIVSILPIFLIGLFIYKKDKRKEPSKLLLKLFICGISSCFPALFLEVIFGSFLPDMNYMNIYQIFLYSFFVIALSEEFCKWFFVYKISYRHDEFDSLYDMIVYASFVALGFACFENLLYVSSKGILAGFLRAISAVPGHVCDGIFMGSYLSLAKINEIRGNNNSSKKYKIYSLVIPTMVHGIYDFCLFSGNLLLIGIFLIYVIVLFIICFKKVGKISSNNFKFRFRNNYCINCGLEVTSKFCTRCGNENN